MSETGIEITFFVNVYSLDIATIIKDSTRSMIYKDMLYKDQNFPSTERLCSDDVIVTT